MTTPPFDSEHLLGQAGRLRALARKLTADSHAAEDVVQETWVAALEADVARIPTPQEESGWRAWLGGVTRNLARKRAYKDALRRHYERAASRPESSDDPEEIELRLLEQRRIGDALLKLREPYRSALALRYLDGLEYEEIAQRQRTTPANVRQRVSRALSMLRSELGESQFHGMETCLAWLALVGPRVREMLTGNSAKLSLGFGGALMGTKAWSGVAAVALAVVAWTQFEETDATLGVDSAEFEESNSLAVLSEPEEIRPVEELEAPASPLGRSSSEGPVGVSSPPAYVTGIVRDPLLQPIAGVELTWVKASPERVPVGSTDEQGRFRIERQEGFEILLAEGEAHLPKTVLVGEESELEIVLRTRPVLTGRLTNPEGEFIDPPGYVRCEVRPAGAGYTHHVRGDLLKDGSYRVNGLPEGTIVAVKAHARGFRPYEADTKIELVAETTSNLDIELPRGLVATGVVRDAVTQEPIPYARVWADDFEYKEDNATPGTIADENGVYRIEGLEERVLRDETPRYFAVVLAGDSPEHAPAPFEPRIAPEISEGVCEVDLLLERRSCSLKATFYETDGKTLAKGLQVVLIDAKHNFEYKLTDGNGQIDFGTLPEGKIGLRAIRRGRTASGALAGLLVDVELVNGDVKDERFVLEEFPESYVAGTVVNPDGKPLAGYDVALRHDVNFEGLSFGFDHDATKSDLQGRFRFKGIRFGPHRISAGSCEYPSPESLFVERDARIDDITLVAGGCRDVSGWVDLGTRSNEGLWVELRSLEDGEYLSRKSLAKETEFRFEKVLDQEYELALGTGAEDVLDTVRVPRGDASRLVLRAP